METLAKLAGISSWTNLFKLFKEAIFKKGR